MGKIVSVFNQKGGVGKTTSSYELASGLSILHKKKVLVLDMDGQLSLTNITNADKEGLSTLHLMSYYEEDGKWQPYAKASEAIQHLAYIDIIPGNKNLATPENFIKKEPGDNTPEPFERLRIALSEVKDRYDYIVIDCPPNLGILTVSAIVASDKIVIPCRVGKMSLDALIDAQQTIAQIKESVNPDVEVDGVLITQTQGRTLISRGSFKSTNDIAKAFNTKVYKARIRYGEKDVEESLVSGQSLFEYAPKGKTTQDYAEFIAEFLKGDK